MTFKALRQTLRRIAAPAVLLLFVLAPLPLAAQTRLQVTRDNASQLSIRWPAADTGFSLESAPALLPASAWSIVNTPPTLVGQQWSVSLPLTSQIRFFRLRRTSAHTTAPTLLESSPAPGEVGVAVTRETIFRLSAPLAPSVILGPSDLFAEFAGRTILSRPELAADRRSLTLFYLEHLPASARIRVTLDGSRLVDAAGNALDADGDGQAGGVRVLEFQTAGIVGLPNTAVVGRVFASERNPDGSNRPLRNVTITVDGAEETLRTTTDADGAFLLSPAPAGRFFVHVDGRTAQGSQWPDGAYYPFVGKAWDAIAGSTNNLAGGTGDIFLPRIQEDALTVVSPTESTPVTFSPAVLAENPALAGVEIVIPPNALFSDSGTRGGRVGMAPVAPDRLPEPLPPGLNLPLVITVQTDGPSNFDQPIPVRFPNLPDPITGLRLPPGAKTVLWSFNHDTGRWEPQGTMTISADGNFAVSDPGVGLRQPGWHGTAPGSTGRGPTRRNPDPDNNTSPDPDCEGDECECTQQITCVVPKPGKGVATCALTCLGNVVDDIFGDGPKPPRTAFETGLRCIGGPDKCPGRPEDTLDKKRRDCMDECVDPLPDRIVYTVPCEGFTDPCGGPSLHAPHADGSFANLIPDRLVEQRLFWEVEGEFLVQLTGTPKILESESDEVPRLTAFFDAFADRVRADSPSGIRLSAGERAELVALPRPAHFSAADWAAMIDRLDSLQGQPLPASLAAAEQRLTSLTAELVRRGWQGRGDGLLHGLARRSRHAAPAVGSPEFPARAHFYYLKDHENAFIQRGRLNAQGQFDGLILAPGAFYTVAYLDPVTLHTGVAFFQARSATTTTPVPSAPLAPIDPSEPDTDADGLPNVAEIILGTAPDQADSDRDGVPDGLELQLGTSPLDGVGLPIGVVSVTPAPGAAIDVAAGNDLALLASQRGLVVYDVAHPSSPVQLAVVPGNATAVSFLPPLALVAFSDAVRLIDLTQPSSPRIVWQRTDLTDAAAVTLDGTAAYAAKSTQVFRLRLSDGSGPGVDRLHSRVIEALISRGDLLYILGSSQLTVCRSGDILQSLASLNAPGSGGAGGRPRRLFLDGPRLFAQHTAGFNVFDLADPTLPTLITNHQTTQAGWRQVVATGTGLALAADGPNSTSDGPHNVSLYRLGPGASSLQFVSTFVTPGSAFAVAIAGARAFVADGNAGLSVINFLAPDLAGLPPSATVSIDTPSSTPRLEGSTTARIAAQATDDVAVRLVELYVNDQLITRDDSYPFEIFFPVPPASPSNTSLRARVIAEDTAGNRAASPETTVAVVADATPPAVTALEPAPDSVIPTAVVTDLTVTFSEPVVSPVTPTTLSLLSAGPDGTLDTPDDTPLPGVLTYLPESNTLRLRLADPLIAMRYRATLDAGPADAAGNARTRPLSWEFETGAPPTIRDLFPPANYVNVGGTLDELRFQYDQPVPAFLFDAYSWNLTYRTVAAVPENLGPAVTLSGIDARLSSDRRLVTLRIPGGFPPGYYVVTGTGPVLPGMRWEFYFRDTPNEAVSLSSNGDILWKYPPGIGIGDELTINLPGRTAAVNTFGIRSLLAYSPILFLRQRVFVPTPIQALGALTISSTTFGPGSTEVHGPVQFTGTFIETSQIGPHTLHLRGGGLSRTRVDLSDPQGVIINHPGSLLLLTNSAAFHGNVETPSGRFLNLGTLRTIASSTAAAVSFDDLLLRNEGRIELLTHSTRIENLENDGTVEVADGARLHLPLRYRGGVNSRISGPGSLELGEYNPSTRRVTASADAEFHGDLDLHGPIALTAGSLSLRRPWIRSTPGFSIQNNGTLRCLAPARISDLNLADGNLVFNSDAEIGNLIVGSRADLRVATLLRITGDASIQQGIDALGGGIVEFAGATLVTNGTQSGGAYLGTAILRNSGTWTQAINSSQGSVLSPVNEDGLPSSGWFENTGTFLLATQRPLGIYVPFRNRGRLSLSRTTVTLDARQSIPPTRRGAYLPEPGADLILNETTLDFGFSGTLDLAAGTVRGIGTIVGVSSETRPRIINRGILRPGNPTGTLSLRATDGFEQTPAGAVIITLTPTGSGLLRLDRTPATLAGALTLELSDGFSPEIGQSFTLVTFPSRTGEFTSLQLPDLGPTKRFEINHEPSSVTARVVAR